MACSNCRKLGAFWAITQGLLLAVVPQVNIKLMKWLIGRNFENAAALEAKPNYYRDLRALGIGLVASGISCLVMGRVADRDKT